jgi:D-tyrosyl-tRNA(Tyr) deacylase
MRAVILRVSEASVVIEGKEERSVGRGLLILSVSPGTIVLEEITWMVEKNPGMRIFADSEGRMNLLFPNRRDAMVVSQFTLPADTKKGNRPSFDPAAPPESRYRFTSPLSRNWPCPGTKGLTGEFGASMRVSLVNEGPVTIILDSRSR